MNEEAQQWINLHENMTNGKLDKSEYYVTDTSQQGNGEIKLVSPTQAQVDQAKMEIKRKVSVVRKPPAKRRKQSGGGKKKPGPKRKTTKGQRGGKIVKKAKKRNTVKRKLKKIRRKYK